MASKTKHKQKKQLPILGIILGVFILIAFFLRNTANTRYGGQPNYRTPLSEPNTIATLPTTNPTTTTPSPKPILLPNNTFISPVLTDNDKKFTFSLLIPKGWIVTQNDKQNSSVYYNLSLVKGKYTLHISLPDGSASTCYFGKEEEAPGEYIDQYEEINTDFGILRIGHNRLDLYAPDAAIFRVCQKTKYGEWAVNTKIGIIEFNTPYQYDETIIREIKNVIKEIKISYLQ